jgi:NAD(P)-dependent dehydrogenase (short-subunit alcohol dehydrogenase family)
MKQRWTEDSVPSQTGKVVIVTGGNSGIGFDAARTLAERGAQVVLACRNEQKAEKAAQQIREKNSSANIEVSTLDLSNLSSVRAFAKSFQEKHQRLDILCNNAGVMIPPYGTTVDGFELQFGTNHLGHFALTGWLLPILLNTPNSRVVTVSSMAHRQGKVAFDNLNAEHGYSAIRSYGLSKLANLLFTYELDRQLQTRGLSCMAVACHPGWTATNLQANSKILEILNPWFGQRPEMGALPTLYAATAEQVVGGDYIGPDGFYEIKGYPTKVRSNKRSHDPAVARKLWEVSEKLTGVSFTFGENTVQNHSSESSQAS